MAGLLCSLVPANGIAFSAGVAKTGLILTAPANHRLHLVQFGAGTTLASPTVSPGKMTLYRATTAGTFTSLTPVRMGAGSESPLASGGYNATVEPTMGDILKVINIDRGYAESRALDKPIVIPGGTRIAIKFEFAVAVAILPYFEFEE